ncbi:MAG: hypothetical protein K0Q56_1506 [Sporolactobacillus laevolacticus]|jgi:hypothetical protein|nr:hypothetical protein [Sporolactobacillus laevolacticus]
MDDVIVYSKRKGTNQFLFQVPSFGRNVNLVDVCELTEKEHRDEIPFVYALVNGKEIKLFST